MIEVELKHMFKDEPSYTQIQRRLEQEAAFIEEVQYITILFLTSSFLRLRWTPEGDTVTVTHKAGVYTDIGRQETQFHVAKKEYPELIDFLTMFGYDRCVVFPLTRRVYKKDNARLELSDIPGIGRFLEAERITDDPIKVPHLRTQLTEIMRSLGCPPDDLGHLQSVMEGIWGRLGKPYAAWDVAQYF